VGRSIHVLSEGWTDAEGSYAPTPVVTTRGYVRKPWCLLVATAVHFFARPYRQTAWHQVD